jgi:hypothetical protein
MSAGPTTYIEHSVTFGYFHHLDQCPALQVLLIAIPVVPQQQYPGYPNQFRSGFTFQNLS